VVTHQLQVERRTGKVRRSNTTFYCCATQPVNHALPTLSAWKLVIW